MSNWRVGRKVPLNVYCDDAPWFQCHTPEAAAEVTALLTAGEQLPWYQSKLAELERKLAEEAQRVAGLLAQVETLEKRNRELIELARGYDPGERQVLLQQVDALKELIRDYLRKCKPPASWSDFDAAEEALRKAVDEAEQLAPQSQPSEGKENDRG